MVILKKIEPLIPWQKNLIDFNGKFIEIKNYTTAQ